MPFAETVVKGPVGSLMNRWSSHLIVRECSEHRCKGFRRVSGVNLVLEGALRRTAHGAGSESRRSGYELELGFRRGPRRGHRRQHGLLGGEPIGLSVVEQPAFRAQADDTARTRLHDLPHVLVRQRRGRYENRSFIPIDVDPVEHEHLYVGVEIQGGTESLDEGYRAPTCVVRAHGLRLGYACRMERCGDGRLQ